MDPMEFLVKRGLDCKSKQALILKDPDGETVYCCSECPQRYAEKELMELHLCMHNKEYRFICSICGRGLKRKEHLERHMLEHQEVRPFPCSECGKAFKRKEHLNIHKNIHSNYRDYVCPLCTKTFHRKDHLQKHMQIHNKEPHQPEFVEVSPDVDISQNDASHNDESYNDESCNDESLNDESLNDVLQNGFSHEGVDVKEEPEDDERVSSTIDVDTLLKLQDNVPALLETSMKSEDPERPFACCICLKTFKRKDHLKLHNYSHMKKDKVCSQCGKGFHKQEQLLVHMNQHAMSEALEAGAPPPGLCWQAPDVASDSSLLLPMGEEGVLRPHACGTCGKRFKRRQHLKVHEFTHERKPLASIWCSICNEGFYSNDKFEQHTCLGRSDCENTPAEGGRAAAEEEEEAVPQDMVVDEGCLPVPLAVRVYVCKYCGKQFRRKDHFKIHLNIHTGVKTLFCPYCGKGFYRKDHMQKHIQVHEKKKKTKKMPELLPMTALPPAKKQAVLGLNLPEITIHAPSNSKLRVPLKMKVPYQVVTSSESGERRAVIVHPT